MRLIHLIFLTLLAIFCIVAYLMLAQTPGAATGIAHSTIEGMRIGGDGLDRLGGQGPLIFVFQCLTLLLTFELIALGVAQPRRTRGFWVALGVAFLVSLAIWVGMYTTYMTFLQTGQFTTLFGFATPTTIMLLGVFTGGSVLCVLYIWGFERFIYTPEDEAAYEALRAEAQAPRVDEHAHHDLGTNT